MGKWFYIDKSAFWNVRVRWIQKINPIIKVHRKFENFSSKYTPWIREIWVQFFFCLKIYINQIDRLNQFNESKWTTKKAASCSFSVFFWFILSGFQSRFWFTNNNDKKLFHESNVMRIKTHNFDVISTFRLSKVWKKNKTSNNDLSFFSPWQ